MRHTAELLRATLTASLMLVALAGAEPQDGAVARLAQSELDALRAKLIAFWNPPEVTPRRVAEHDAR